MVAETIEELAKKECVPCKGGTPALKGPELTDMHRKLGKDWGLIDDHHIEKTFKFPDFKSALAFTNRVGEIAEEQNHHPDILLTYGKARVTIFTHTIDGLTESDFVLAAKVEKAYA
ncbi:MAG: 4a-hydroxytetrahydrobiopterin dehydratase [Candidatus Hydrogenedentota bacterium]